VPFGLLIGRLKGVDVRTAGSGNIGATNVGRVLGRSWGLLVFALDVLKGLVPTFVAGEVLKRSAVGVSAFYLLWVCVAAACIIGHMFPIYLGFRGGKGVATSLGALLGLYPFFTLPVLLALGLWIALTLTTRYVSVGSVAAAIAVPCFFAIMAYLKREQWGSAKQLWPLYLFGIVIAGLVVLRHRGNLRRLRQGIEPRIGALRRG